MVELNRPIVFFDLETTGVDREKDKIVQMSFIKYVSPDQAAKRLTYLINPEMPIPEASTKIHGITDEMVKDAPTFQQVANVVFNFVYGCDIGGFNSNWFDVPILFYALERAGFIWHPGHLLDAGNIFKIMEPRTLAAAYKFYCGKELDGAHNAENDVTATMQVFFSQLERYPDLPKTVEGLALFSNYNCKVADLSGKFMYDIEGVLRFNFGKHKGQPALDYPDFLNWMYYKAYFPADTNRLLESILCVEVDEESNDLPF